VNPRIAGLVVSLAAAAFSARLVFVSPSLTATLMLLYSLLAAAATVVMPKRDCTFKTVNAILLLLASTLLAYWAENLWLLFAGWSVSTVPFLGRRRPAVALIASTVVLAAAIVIIQNGGSGGMLAFTLLIVAVVLRKGLLPAHVWVGDAADAGPVIPTALLINGHLGALLVLKVIVPLFPQTVGRWFPVLSYLAMATAVYVAIRALAENSPRRLIAFLALSQSACILAGLESRIAEGITGALVHWVVVSISTTGLFAILRLLEVRFGENLTAARHLGLAEHAPRLAVFFVVFGLALVGLPGTLSFCSQDLLIHGTLASHPLTGILLPVATAMNAVSLFRLFTRLFLGTRRTGFTITADALPRERFVLAAGTLFVVAGGLFPAVIVRLLK
jgi:NADH-quinone oxidoreductase subunit M